MRTETVVYSNVLLTNISEHYCQAAKPIISVFCGVNGGKSDNMTIVMYMH